LKLGISLKLAANVKRTSSRAGQLVTLRNSVYSSLLVILFVFTQKFS
jgi:hypothetical protein